MKLLTFEVDGRIRPGAWHNERVIDLAAAAALSSAGPPRLPGSLRELLALGAEGLALVRAALAEVDRADPVALAGVAFDREAVRLLAPVPDPTKIIAIGLNYRDHCAEQNIPVPEVLTVFAKFPSAIIGDRQPIVLPPPDVTTKVDYEVELGVIIGRRGVDIPRERVYDYIAGYTVCNDVSARDVQKGDGGGQWIHGKSFDTFSPQGPWLVTVDELPDPHGLGITMDVNGVRRQASHTGNLVFDVPTLVAELSRSITLEPGDVIQTGTPGGVGLYSDPPTFLQPGDVCVATIEGIGCLTNPVMAR